MSDTRGPVGVLVVLVLVVAGSTVALSGGAAAQSQVTLTVTVVDQDGDPLSGIDLSATWDDGEGGPVNETTRANGQALVDIPGGADVSITVHDDEFVRNVPFEVEDASTRDVEVDVSRGATATVSVVGTGGEPIEDARVRLFTDGNYVSDQRTGSDGTVTSPLVEEGTYTIIATKPGFFRNTTRTTVVGENETSISLSEGSVLLTFNVVDDHFDPDEPMRDARIQVGDVGTVQTLSNGQATISVPVNDRYDLRITKDGYQTYNQMLSVRESEMQVNVSISRTPQINVTSANDRVVVDESVRLSVTDEYDEAVPNATISRDGETVGTTDASGEVTVTVPTAGNVTFTAESGSLSSEVTIEGVEPGAATTETMTATATATATDQPTTDSTGTSGPGFTPVLALLAVALVAALLARVRR